jgi:hypothetical protein
MADDVRINMDDTNAKLAQMAAAMDGQQLATAVRAGLLPIEVLAKVIVAKITGTLARSIHIEVQAGDASAAGRVGTNVEYALIQELRPGKAYMRPAYDAKKEEAVEETREALKIIVRTAAAQ